MNEETLLLLIKEAFHYDPVTGELFWRSDRPRTHFKRSNEYQSYLNTRAGKLVKTSISAYGYFVVGLYNRVFLVHRIAYVIMSGRFPTETIDHIDGNQKNNKWENLREVSQAVNTRNQKRNCRNTSGFAGVFWVKRDQKWSSQVCIDGTQLSLGNFSTAEEAFQARVSYLNTRPDLQYSEDHGQR